MHILSFGGLPVVSCLLWLADWWRCLAIQKYPINFLLTRDQTPCKILLPIATILCLHCTNGKFLRGYIQWPELLIAASNILPLAIFFWRFMLQSSFSTVLLCEICNKSFSFLSLWHWNWQIAKWFKSHMMIINGKTVIQQENSSPLSLLCIDFNKKDYYIENVHSMGRTFKMYR